MENSFFIEHRKMFYIDPNVGIVKTPDSRHANMTTAEWFTDYGMTWINIVRGYFWESENHENDFLMIYSNNYEIPTIGFGVIIYLFHFFPTVKYIGLGCIKGEENTIWSPQLTVYKNDTSSK